MANKTRLEGIQEHLCLPIPSKYLEFEKHDDLEDKLKERVCNLKEQLGFISEHHLEFIDGEARAKSDREACEKKVEKCEAGLRALERCQSRTQRFKVFSKMMRLGPDFLKPLEEKFPGLGAWVEGFPSTE